MDPAPDPNQKYDRQIRIWGESGQVALEHSRVCVLNASATGTECLKNLVLPGIGGFTLVDGATCTPRDLGSNFFVPHTAVAGAAERARKRAGAVGDDKDERGQELRGVAPAPAPVVDAVHRAEAAAQMLKELNPAVDGGFIAEDVADVMARQDPVQFFKQFGLVIATQVPYGETLRRVADACWEAHVPLMVVRAYGMVGFVRVVVRELCVEQSREEEAADLRMVESFDALDRLVHACHLDTMDQDERPHVPFVTILCKALREWRNRDLADRSSRAPRNRTEQSELKEIVRSWRRKETEDNFAEAEKNARLLWTGTQGAPPPEVALVLASDRSAPSPELWRESPNKRFWLLAAAVRRFVENEGAGKLPLKGSVPDMSAGTDNYVELQRMYVSKAEADAAVVWNHAQHIASSLDCLEDITEFDVKEFCKNSDSIQVLEYRSLAEELEPHPLDVDLASEGPESDFFFYVLLRAADKFKGEQGRFPGEPKGCMVDSGLIDADMVLFRGCVSTVLSETSLGTGAVPGDYIMEMCRFGGAELHNVAALMGGLVAQEAVKLITKQFVPVSSAFIFNAMRCTSTTFEV